MAKTTTRNKMEYPLDNQEQFTAKIKFQAITVNPPEFPKDMNAAETWDKATRGELNVTKDRVLNPSTITLGDIVDLYLPVSFQVNDTLAYETPSLGAAGAAALAGIQSGSGIVQSALSALAEGSQGIMDLFSGASTGNLGRLATVRAASIAPIPQGVRDAVGIAARAVMNPNVRASFRQVNIRRFSFQFKFIPRSPAESAAVTQIIHFFRYHAYPEELFPDERNQTIPIGFNYPDLFRIKVFTKAGTQFVQTGTHIKDCYLESITTNYNPTLVTYHKDGSPVEIDLTLNFMEHRTLNRKDIVLPVGPGGAGYGDFKYNDINDPGIRVEVIPGGDGK